ncbi:MAG: class I SAM-dependent methyltransferase [Rhodobacteraceae bacterium]|nr:class I SAM-dependent methyltransferase [Paracoccaceae bacterium]
MTDQHYDAFPYPARDPADEAKRLVTGSPSHPHEIDTVLYGGARDWSQPFKVLVAGGGTGDGLVMLAQVLADAKAPYEITYLDQSKAAREIAEARIAKRRLKGVRFETGSLVDAADYGSFDYIDCCGVLHHLKDPVAGLKALERALNPGAGLGFMVYAPSGRSGVYPLQEAFNGLYGALPPEEKLEAAKKVMATLPEWHPFRRNALLSDQLRDPSGFYDLLLYAQDRAYRVDEWLAALGEAGLELTRWDAPALYDLGMITEVPEGMDPVVAIALCEKLRGTLGKYTGYAQRKGEVSAQVTVPSMGLVPHLDAPRHVLAKAVAAGKPLKMTTQGVTFRLKLPEEAAAIIGRIDGKTRLSEIVKASGLEPIGFQALWLKLHKALTATGSLRYSSLGRS